MLLLVIERIVSASSIIDSVRFLVIPTTSIAIISHFLLYGG